MALLEQEFKWYQENQTELVNEFNGRVLVIKNQKVIGTFED